jgi:hypothetical protein
VGLALTLACVAVGLVCGGLAGFWLGSRIRGERRVYWSLNAAAVVGCALLDFVGLVTGRYWLAYSALGLMGGLITGMKYGFVDSIRVWQDPGPAEIPANEPTDAPKGTSPALDEEIGDSSG